MGEQCAHGVGEEVERRLEIGDDHDRQGADELVPAQPTAGIVRQPTGATAAACSDIGVVCAGFVYSFVYSFVYGFGYGVELARCLVAVNPGAHAPRPGAVRQHRQRTERARNP
jgi:hypothetical protein